MTLNFPVKTDVMFNWLMPVCKQTPRKNVQLVNRPSENTAHVHNRCYQWCERLKQTCRDVFFLAPQNILTKSNVFRDLVAEVGLVTSRCL